MFHDNCCILQFDWFVQINYKKEEKKGLRGIIGGAFFQSLEYDI